MTTSVVRRLASAAIGIAVGVAIAAPVAGCTAARLAPPGTAHDLAAADLAFTGTVVRVDEMLVPGNHFLNAAWTFAVDEVHKGQASSRMTILSSRESASCGAGFRLGHRYAVYATRGDSGSLEAWLGDAEQIEPLENPPALEQTGFYFPPWTAAAAGGVGLILLVMFVAVAFRRSMPGPGGSGG
jgi:hypothetical protein